MARTENFKANDPLLLLGRLDGRFLTSACADIFMARSRLAGAAALAGLAGVPIGVSDLQRWIAGRSPPPRTSEGLNDPISVAAVFHLALSRDEDIHDPVNQATLNILRSVLDDRAAATVYPGLQASAVSKLLKVTPQGARKLLETAARHSGPVLV